MTTELEVGLYIFMLAGFLGYHIITRVPPLLHTPLMSATNAIAGDLAGRLAGGRRQRLQRRRDGWVSTLLGFIAVACSATNVVGGFLITDRMLRMFKTAERREKAHAGRAAGAVAASRRSSRWSLLLLLRDQARRHGDRGVPREHVAATSLRYCLHRLGRALHPGPEGPELAQVRARRHVPGRVRHVLAVVGTLFHHDIVNYRWIALGLLIGAVVGGAMGCGSR